MRRVLALALFSSFVGSHAAFAEPIFINHDFDDRTPGIQGYFDRNLYLVTSMPGGVFNSVDIVASPDAISPPNLVRPAFEGSALRGSFLSDDTPHSTLATRILFVTITGAPSPVPYTLSIFDRNGLLLSSATASISQGIGFTLPSPGIASFLFQPGAAWQGLDDVRYSTPVIPEPGTMLLVASGMAAAAWRRRKGARADQSL